MAPVPLIAVVLRVGPVEEAVFLGVLPKAFGGCRCGSQSSLHLGVVVTCSLSASSARSVTVRPKA